MIGIPPAILCHSCVLRIYEQGLPLGERILKSEVRLKKVRLQMSARKKADAGGVYYEHRGKMFYDCRASEPAEAVFMESGCESFITYRNREYALTGVRYIYDGDELHHLEIELGGGE